MMARTIFERYGGFASVSRVVSSFYNAVLDDPMLASYFAGVDMARLMDHQTKFIATIMGGPASYSNEHLARVHERHHITDEAFDRSALLLRETLEDHGMDETDIGEVYGAFLARRPVIVRSGQGAEAAPATP